MDLRELLETGYWTNRPLDTEPGPDGSLRIAAAEGSDAWRHTSYGFVHDSEHALLVPMQSGEAVEATVVLDYTEQFDQAGVFLRADESTWIKAGVEVSDGVAQLGAVVTHGSSDWSVAPVPDWHGRPFTIRASRDGDAVTIRARVEDEPWRLVRVAYLDPAAHVEAGVFCAAPTRAGLTVTVTSFRTGPADAALHP